MKLYISYNPAGFETDPTAMSVAIQDFFEELRGVQLAPRMANDFVWFLFRKQSETVSLYVKGSNIERNSLTLLDCFSLCEGIKHRRRWAISGGHHWLPAHIPVRI